MGRVRRGGALARPDHGEPLDRPLAAQPPTGADLTPLGESDHAASLADDAPSPDRRVQGRETGERLAAALGRLPERQRAVVVLRHYQDMSLEEIAQALGMSLGTVKSSLHRALARMRAGLAGARP